VLALTLAVNFIASLLIVATRGFDAEDRAAGRQDTPHSTTSTTTAVEQSALPLPGDASSTSGPPPSATSPPPATRPPCGGVDLATAVLAIELHDDQRADIVAIAADGSARRTLFSRPLAMGIGGASWSPDRSHIAYGVETGAHVARADGSDDRVVVPERQHGPAAGEYAPRWSPDGKWIVASVPGVGLRDIWKCPVDGSGCVPLTTAGQGDEYFYPDWAADGRRILFSRYNDGGGIAVMDADGRNLRFVYVNPDSAGTINGAAAQLARWSPDGQHIAFAGCGGTCDLWAMRSDGSGAHALRTTDADERWLAWSRDGHEVVFSSDGFRRGETTHGAPELAALAFATGAVRSVARGDFFGVDW
jgi:dipeptidyl aminopeptidase/acylaminoacyl peptidase